MDQLAADLRQVRQHLSSLLKAVITAFPSVSLPFLAVPLLSRRSSGRRSRRAMPGCGRSSAG
eukprot:SAG22_NODE_1626_length_3956_cov_2.706767_4_plen_62_part_00